MQHGLRQPHVLALLHQLHEPVQDAVVVDEDAAMLDLSDLDMGDLDLTVDAGSDKNLNESQGGDDTLLDIVDLDFSLCLFENLRTKLCNKGMGKLVEITDMFNILILQPQKRSHLWN